MSCSERDDLSGTAAPQTDLLKSVTYGPSTNGTVVEADRFSGGLCCGLETISKMTERHAAILVTCCYAVAGPARPISHTSGTIEFLDQFLNG